MGDESSRMARIPGIRRFLEARFERRFASEVPDRGNWYRGVYVTFAEARAHVPAARPIGYDHAETAALYRDRTRRVYPSDYPVMFWLARCFAGGARSVFDLGGHIGIGYYAYRRYLDYPEGLRWLVHDVPAVNASGIAHARDHDPERRLGFTASATDADGTDVLFASGSLQYLDYTLPDLLARLANPPRTLLLNLVPVHPTKGFFTVQNMGTAFCPYRISAERPFVDGIKATGYTLRDRWENLEKACRIAFEPEHSLDRYFGFCFER